MAHRIIISSEFRPLEVQLHDIADALESITAEATSRREEGLPTVAWAEKAKVALLVDQMECPVARIESALKKIRQVPVHGELIEELLFAA